LRLLVGDDAERGDLRKARSSQWAAPTGSSPNPRMRRPTYG